MTLFKNLVKVLIAFHTDESSSAVGWADVGVFPNFSDKQTTVADTIHE